MIAPADGGHGQAVLAGGGDDRLHGDVHRDLPHGVGTVDDDSPADLPLDSGRGLWFDAVLCQLLDIVRHPKRAVAVDATQVGLDKRVGQQSRVGLPHATGCEDARHLVE